MLPVSCDPSSLNTSIDLNWKGSDQHWQVLLLDMQSDVHFDQCLSETGFAKVAGMEEDLHLVGLRYNIAAAIFFVRARSSHRLYS